MRRILFATFMATLFSGCGPELEYTTATTEPGKVSKLVFLPSGHGDDVAVGVGFDGKGRMTTSVTPINIDIPARYGIVFECTHGTFAIEGEKWVTLWKGLKEGQRVVIEYREVYEVDKTAGIRRFAKFDFLGAVPMTPPRLTAEKSE